MGEDFKEKVKSLGFPRKVGQSEKVPVLDERDGSIGGYHIKHWDGRQDAHITPKPVEGFARAQEGSEDR